MMQFRGTGGLGRCFGDVPDFMGGYMHSGGGLLMMVGALIVIALIVVAIVLLVRRAHRANSAEQSSDSLAALNERFVKGEITEEEYIRMKKVLKTK